MVICELKVKLELDFLNSNIILILFCHGLSLVVAIHDNQCAENQSGGKLDEIQPMIAQLFGVWK